MKKNHETNEQRKGEPVESVCSAQVRAICAQIAYHSKLEVSSLSGDFKNAHRSPAGGTFQCGRKQ